MTSGTGLFHDKQTHIRHTVNTFPDLVQQGQAIVPDRFVLIHDHDIIKELVDRSGQKVIGRQDMGKVAGPQAGSGLVLILFNRLIQGLSAFSFRSSGLTASVTRLFLVMFSTRVKAWMLSAAWEVSR